MFLPRGFHLWIVKTFDPLDFKSPLMFDPRRYMGSTY